MTHCTVAWVLLAVFDSLWITKAAIIAGPVALALVHVVYIVWPRLTHDPAKHSLDAVVGDLLVDLSLASVVVVLALFQEANFGEGPGRGVAAVLGLVLAFTYWAMLPHSRP